MRQASVTSSRISSRLYPTWEHADRAIDLLDAGEPSALDEMLRRAAARGEIGPGEVSPRIAAVAVDLVRHDLIMNQAPMPDADLVAIVDDIYLPLVRRAAAAPAR